MPLKSVQRSFLFGRCKPSVIGSICLLLFDRVWPTFFLVAREISSSNVSIDETFTEELSRTLVRGANVQRDWNKSGTRRMRSNRNEFRRGVEALIFHHLSRISGSDKHALGYKSVPEFSTTFVSRGDYQTIFEDPSMFSSTASKKRGKHFCFQPK